MWFFSATCASKAQLIGKVAVITGGNTGIGKETAKDFYKRGARVIIACRSLERAEQAKQDIIKDCAESETKGEIEIHQLDLNNLSQVRQSAQKLLEKEPKINLLINNAGVMITAVRNTDDGNETHFGVNHLGHFLFTLILLPRIIKSGPARIVNVSSVAHNQVSKIDFDDINYKNKSYGHISAYGQSKLANILFTKELARRFEERSINNVTTYSLHPGVIATELGRNMDNLLPGLKFFWRVFARWSIKTPVQGAQTTIHCAVDENAGKETGLYYSECKVTSPSRAANNMEAAKKLWDVSLEMTGIEPSYDPFKPA